MHILNNLKSLYHSMCDNNEIATIFNINYNKRQFRCLFLADEFEKTLFLSANHFVIKFDIYNDFSFSTGLTKAEYKNLVEYLNLKYDPENKFYPYNFLLQADSRFPTHIIEIPTISQRAYIISTYYNNDNAIYFKGWAKWKVKNTSQENQLKTASIVGSKNAQRLKDAHISSCWSNNPDEENLNNLDKWVEYINQKDS